jgi:hypothetical protein
MSDQMHYPTILQFLITTVKRFTVQTRDENFVVQAGARMFPFPGIIIASRFFISSLKKAFKEKKERKLIVTMTFKLFYF